MGPRPDGCEAHAQPRNRALRDQSKHVSNICLCSIQEWLLLISGNPWLLILSESQASNAKKNMMIDNHDHEDEIMMTRRRLATGNPLCVVNPKGPKLMSILLE